MAEPVTFYPALDRAIDRILDNGPAPAHAPEWVRTIMNAAYYALKEIREGLALRAPRHVVEQHVLRYLMLRAELDEL